jgi:hypothetical protein
MSIVTFDLYRNRAELDKCRKKVKLFRTCFSAALNSMENVLIVDTRWRHKLYKNEPGIYIIMLWDLERGHIGDQGSMQR